VEKEAGKLGASKESCLVARERGKRLDRGTFI